MTIKLKGPVNNLSFCKEDRNRILVNDKIWEIDPSKSNSKNLEQSGQICYFFFSQDKKIITVDENYKIVFWDLNSGRI